MVLSTHISCTAERNKKNCISPLVDELLTYCPEGDFCCTTEQDRDGKGSISERHCPMNHTRMNNPVLFARCNSYRTITLN